MTVAGLPGIPGGAAMVPALDMFVAEVLTEHRAQHFTGSPQHEVVGAFIYRHLDPHMDGGAITWTGEIDFVRLENIADDPTQEFVIRSMELQAIVEQELESLRQMCMSRAVGEHRPTEANMFMSGFSPLVGIGHSHPGGTKLPSAADYRLSDAAATWRRAAAPQTIMGKDAQAQFFEADFLFAVGDLQRGSGTLVHFKRGLVRGEWKGDFLPRVD